MHLIYRSTVISGANFKKPHVSMRAERIIMNTNIEKLIKDELIKRGIDVGIEEVEVIKNAAHCKGLKIINCSNSNICPIVYYDQGETITAIADRVVAVVTSDLPAFDIPEILSKDFFAANAYICCNRHDSTVSDVVSRQYLNLDLIIKLRVMADPDSICSIKVTKPFLNIIGLTEDEAFDIAIDNSRKTITIKSMADILGTTDDILDYPMHILSCNQGYGGASAIIFTDVIKNWCMANDLTEVFILPSSTDEMIIISDNTIITDELLRINKDITDSVVEPLISLEPAVYRYSVSDNLVTIAAAEVNCHD